jgi:hypothetical protein
VGVLELGSARAFLLKTHDNLRTETLQWILVSLSSPEMSLLNFSRTVSENA